MSYEVLARKWRPQRFEDVVGQDHVTRTLCNAIESKRLAHAYLFVGPRGIGKTSIARLFAKSLNCEKGPTPEPCGTCDACREIAAGTNLDVLEIDGASHTGVDQVRDLRDTVKFAPTRGPFKIFMIDEVHMLSTAAFNALLKTLEEPPAHVKFIFATTEPQRVLATVISRCQRFDLRRIPVPLIIERLSLIAASEKVKVEEDALLAIARGAEGGLRDAESALDQLISFRGDTISEEDVLSAFGLVARAKLELLVDSIAAGDIRALILGVGELDGGGKDFQRLVVELIEHFRNLLVCLNVDVSEALPDLTDAQVATLRRQASETDTERVLRILHILTESEDRMKYALSRRTLLETALIRCARASTVVGLEKILEKINALRAEGADGRGEPSPRPPPPEQPNEGGGREAEGQELVPSESVPAKSAPPSASFEAQCEQLARDWPVIVASVEKRGMHTGILLVDARPVEVTADRVVLGFDEEFPQEIERFKGGRSRQALETTLAEALGRKVSVSFTLVAVDVGSAADEESPTDDGAPPSDTPPVPRKGPPSRDWSKDEAVRKTLEMFDGSIVDVRE